MTGPIRSLLVANRGEIARRIFRTAARMGIRTIAVYSDPDAGMPHVTDADVAVPIGGSTPAESYLDGGTILGAAERAGADAVHPGYGFLAENADFAASCIDQGLTWVGPPPDAIRAMALKVEAKRVASAAGVPLLPGAELADDADAIAAAASVGYPLLVKASAGGGGRGMRRVDSASELADAVESARREAASAFGDPTVFLERLVDAPRHIEIQVFADMHGEVVHFGERECSIQRRHQKIVEEAPSPAVDAGLRDEMGAAAVELARKIGYVGAGTVEFLVPGRTGTQPPDEFWFLEMNTRLQVEHPVTEAVYLEDLVELQLRVATGERLPFRQHHLQPRGHAIEVRLYAEDPADGFMPSVGHLARFEPPPTPVARWDAGVASGTDVSPHYDPMLAKVIVHAGSRAEAAQRLARALDGLRVHGVRTNRASLAAILRHDAFLAGATTTAFLDEHPEVLDPRPDADTTPRLVAAAALAGAAVRRGTAGVLSFAPGGWRNVGEAGQSVTFETTGGERVAVRYAYAGGAGPATVSVDGTDLACTIHALGDGMLDAEIAGLRERYRVEADVDSGTVWVDSPAGQLELREVPRFVDHDAATAGGGPTAPVPGTVVAVHVSAGDTVEAGTLLVVLEAMKMEHRIEAGTRATVVDLLVAAGDTVDANQLLVRLEEAG